jgi:hypothetical protein
MTYIRNKVPGSVYYKGLVRPGSAVPGVLAKVYPTLFDEVLELPEAPKTIVKAASILEPVVDAAPRVPKEVVVPDLVVEEVLPEERASEAEDDIGEPVPGYSAMNVRDVENLIALVPESQLTAIYVYERGHKHRKMVLRAIEELKER